MVDAATLKKLEDGFAKIQASDSKSLLKKYLTKEVFEALKNKKTSFGSTLLDCVQSGFENHDSGVGIYAPDAEAYSLFSDLFGMKMSFIKNFLNCLLMSVILHNRPNN